MPCKTCHCQETLQRVWVSSICKWRCLCTCFWTAMFICSSI